MASSPDFDLLSSSDTLLSSILGDSTPAMIPIIVTELPLLIYYDLFSSHGVQTVKLRNESEDSTVIVSKSESAAKEALQPRAVSPLPLPPHLQRSKPITSPSRPERQQDVDRETLGRFRATTDYNSAIPSNQDPTTVVSSAKPVAKRIGPDPDEPASSLPAETGHVETAQDPEQPITSQHGEEEAEASNEQEDRPTSHTEEPRSTLADEDDGPRTNTGGGVETPSHSDREDCEDREAGQPPQSQTLVYTATNNNRKKLQDRKRKRTQTEGTPSARSTLR